MCARKVITLLLIAASCLCFAGCRSPNDAQDSTARESAVIGHLQTIDKFITIRTGPDGPLYTVKSDSGKVLAVDLSIRELSAKFPELEAVVEKGVANWAGMDLHR